jgi:hypothetical protein
MEEDGWAAVSAYSVQTVGEQAMVFRQTQDTADRLHQPAEQGHVRLVERALLGFSPCWACAINRNAIDQVFCVRNPWFSVSDRLHISLLASLNTRYLCEDIGRQFTLFEEFHSDGPGNDAELL